MSTDGPPDDGQPIGLLAWYPYRAMERAVLADLAEAGHTDLPQARARLLAQVDDEGTRLSDLADRANVTRPTATSLVDGLVATGYVERAPDPTDGRARLVRPTSRALAAREVARRTESRLEERWTRHLGGADTARLRSLLVRLRQVTDPWAPPPAGQGSATDGSG